jgi:hypothetical protein
VPVAVRLALESGIRRVERRFNMGLGMTFKSWVHDRLMHRLEEEMDKELDERLPPEEAEAAKQAVRQRVDDYFKSREWLDAKSEFLKQGVKEERS